MNDHALALTELREATRALSEIQQQMVEAQDRREAALMAFIDADQKQQAALAELRERKRVATLRMGSKRHLEPGVA